MILPGSVYSSGSRPLTLQRDPQPYGIEIDGQRKRLSAGPPPRPPRAPSALGSRADWLRTPSVPWSRPAETAPARARLGLRDTAQARLCRSRSKRTRHPTTDLVVGLPLDRQHHPLDVAHVDDALRIAGVDVELNQRCIGTKVVAPTSPLGNSPPPILRVRFLSSKLPPLRRAHRGRVVSVP